MQITELFVLPPDVVFVRVADLEPEVRGRLSADLDDVAVSRPGSRVVAKVVDARTADLLRTFQEPCSIVDAVLATSRQLSLDPEGLLHDSFPAIHRLIGAGFLRPASEPNATLRLAPSLRVGTEVTGNRILACVQAMADVEVYQARTIAGGIVALKLARADSDDGSRSICNECSILSALQSDFAPRLIDAGLYEGRPFAIMEWRPGVDVALAAFELRGRSDASARLDLARLCVAIVAGYASLHEQGVTHGDVHPRNILVDAHGCLTILDFGLAASDRNEPLATRPPRGGVGFYFEPEFATAALAKLPPPPASRAGEQYSLGVLVYELFAGTSYIDFSLEREAAHKQIATEPMVPFARRGLPSWPAWEKALCTALEKDATLRFCSVAAFSEALTDALHARAHEESGLPADVVSPIVDDSLHTLVGDLGLGGKPPEAVIDHAPLCSVNYGAAGAAYALYRRAVVANDGLSLAAADVWATWARVNTRTRSAFVSREQELTPDTVGKASLYHTSCGVHAVRVLVASALGDYYTMRHGVRAYLRAARVPSLNLDLTLGRAGLLLGCAHLLDALPNDRFVSRRGLRALGVSLARQIEDALSPLDPIGEETQVRNLGIAHGWAGMLYALLAWHRITRTSPVGMIRERLRQLANAGEPRGRGMRWPWRQPATAGLDDGKGDAYEQSYMAGWCNGSAGFVFLWLLARESYDDATFADLAHAAAWNAWEEPSDSGVEHLCCGSAGRAYAMLAMYRCHGDAAWLQRARELCELAIDNLDQSLGPVWSLYKGALGVAVLAHDLEQPHLARMPLFELERWSMAT